MKIFTSLNCDLCKAPFAPVANQPRSPRHLGCGKAVCHECFEREKSTSKEERKHQCNSDDYCFHFFGFAYFLIDVLSQDSLKLSPKGDGYLLCKPFKVPECPICHDEYSNTLWGKSPFLLQCCNHTLCTSCSKKTRILDERSRIASVYGIICPICSAFSRTYAAGLEWPGPAPFNSKLIDFLTELPEMTRQLEEIDTTKCRFCKECKREQPVDDMFHCEECEKNICATCVVKKHKSHKTPALLEMEATKLSDQLQRISINEVNTFKNLFPGMHKELVDDIGTFGTKLISKEENLKLASNYEDLQKKHEKCIKLKTDFEAICEEYMPHLRECDTKVKGLVESLDNDTN